MIVLVGFMGAGKSTVGREVASRLGVAFVDADDVVEATQGLPVREIFATDGEAGFRRIEAATVTGLLAGPDVVLALGGGALGSAGVRQALRGHHVVLLDVSLEEALRRVGDDPSRPMLKHPDLAGLYAGRQQAYRDAATLVLPVDGLGPAEAATRVLAALPESGVGE